MVLFFILELLEIMLRVSKLIFYVDIIGFFIGFRVKCLLYVVVMCVLNVFENKLRKILKISLKWGVFIFLVLFIECCIVEENC